MKLAVVAQRYGQTINGGAELHARYIAEHLGRHADVEVLTTCAADYVSWKNELRHGRDHVNGIRVRRFRVAHGRNQLIFGRRSAHVFTERHSIADELAWLDAEGPASPTLISYIARHAGDYDYIIFFSYRYYHAYHGARAAASRAVLVPTAERDNALGLAIFKPLFNGVRALMYNSQEERAMIQAVAGNQAVPSVVVGVGSEVPPNPQPSRFRQKHNVRGPFAVYVGRIDENKGCRQLFDFFGSYLRQRDGDLSLVLIGNSLLPIPSHPRIRHLGFLDDTDKFDALAAADLLVVPSFYESLSMVAVEAWALGRPVVANAMCAVLQGQCLRSNAGLCYEDEAEFIGALRAIERDRWVVKALERNGRQFFREHYEWPTIERKYLEMFERLSTEAGVRAAIPAEGWLERRRHTCRPGAEVLASIPSGPSLGGEASGPVRREAGRVVQRSPTTNPEHVTQSSTRDRRWHPHGRR